MQPRPSGAAAGARAQNVPHAATAARLQLTAEPPAWVDVDAVRVGRTPLHALAISPGLHLVRFVNPLLGERLEASVTLEPGAGVRVHADFTSASPQVHVR